jgi:hypothetical protein
MLGAGGDDNEGANHNVGENDGTREEISSDGALLLVLAPGLQPDGLHPTAFQNCTALELVSAPDFIIKALGPPFGSCNTLGDLPAAMQTSAVAAQLDHYFWSFGRLCALVRNVAVGGSGCGSGGGDVGGGGDGGGGGGSGTPSVLGFDGSSQRTLACVRTVLSVGVTLSHRELASHLPPEIWLHVLLFLRKSEYNC